MTNLSGMKKPGRRFPFVRARILKLARGTYIVKFQAGPCRVMKEASIY